MWDDLVLAGKFVLTVALNAHASRDHARVEIGKNLAVGANVHRDAGDLPKNARLGRTGLLAAARPNGIDTPSSPRQSCKK